MANGPATTRLGRITGLLTGAGLLVAASLQAFASTGIHPDCPSLGTPPEPIEIEPPSLRFEKTELGKTNPLPITAPEGSDAEAPPTLTSSDAIDKLLGKDETEESAEPSNSRPELPPAATRLPGVDDDELPRFRRQMFRTDI